jgi:3-hydroxyisobutyrate dehydrogenase-like beta-hydroxyacid dehydrogenase
MKIGFIGLGSMGAPMAANLLQSGFELTVHNRTRSKEDPLARAGARRAPDAGTAAAEAEIVITMVTADPDVKDVLFGPSGVVAGASPGTLVIDMSTIAPSSARSFADRLSLHEMEMLDAPVSGGTEGAERGTLSIFVGGSADQLDRARPVFDAMGSTVTHFGPSGSGQLAKAVNQIIVGGTFLAVAEGMALAVEAGLTDADKLTSALSAGAASSWALENRGRRFVRGEYPFGFRISLHRKDLRIALEEASRVGVSLPASNLLLRLEDVLLEAGLDDLDLSAVSKAVEED